MNESCTTCVFKLSVILGWGSIRLYSQYCQIVVTLAQVLGFPDQEKNDEIGEEPLSSGVLAGNNSACREVRGVGGS